MQIKSVQFDEKNDLNNIDVELSNEEIKWFVAFALNILFKAGKFSLKEGKYIPNDDLEKVLKGKNA